MTELTLYINKSDSRKVGKSINKMVKLESVHIKENTSIINPVFRIYRPKVSDVGYDLLKANYCYCAKTNRYYFIDDIIMATGHDVEIHCTVDVLETYKNTIRDTTTLVERQSKKYSPYIVDNELRIRLAKESEKTARKIDIDDVFFLGNDYSYIITLVGGV